MTVKISCTVVNATRRLEITVEREERWAAESDVQGVLESFEKFDAAKCKKLREAIEADPESEVPTTPI